MSSKKDYVVPAENAYYFLDLIRRIFRTSTYLISLFSLFMDLNDYKPSVLVQYIYYLL